MCFLFNIFFDIVFIGIELRIMEISGFFVVVLWIVVSWGSSGFGWLIVLLIVVFSNWYVVYRFCDFLFCFLIVVWFLMVVFMFCNWVRVLVSCVLKVFFFVFNFSCKFFWYLEVSYIFEWEILNSDLF